MDTTRKLFYSDLCVDRWKVMMRHLYEMLSLLEDIMRLSVFATVVLLLTDHRFSQYC